MSVFLQFINVIVRRSAVERSYPGGLEQFERDVPNATYCADQYLARVGFMAPSDAEAFVECLEELGLHLSTDGESDICVVDQLSGPTRPCRWLRFELDNQLEARCWWAGDEPGELAVPQPHRWEPEHGHFEGDDARQSGASESAPDKTRRAECPSCGRLFGTRAGRDQHVAAKHPKSDGVPSSTRTLRPGASKDGHVMRSTSANPVKAAEQRDGRLGHGVGTGRRRSLYRGALDLVGAGLGFLIGAALLIGMVGGGVVSRQACTDSQTGQVNHGAWGIDPLAWFGTSSLSGDEICESETGWQYLAGKVPVLGESLERTIGGPQNPAYYEGSDAVFDRRLVREVGAGSVALEGYDEFVDRAMSFQSAYGPAENRTMERLLRGEVFNVSDSDLDALQAAADEGKAKFETELRTWRGAERELRAAEVPEAEYEELGAETREFLEAWNHLLLANADELGGLANYLDKARPLFAGNEQLIAAARRAQASRSLSAYELVRRKTVREVLAMVRSLRRLEASDTTKAEKRVADLYDADTDAQVLVSIVNKQYPDGYLADHVGERMDR